jgi:hypothetical protein
VTLEPALDRMIEGWRKDILTADELAAKKALLSDRATLGRMAERLRQPSFAAEREAAGLPGRISLTSIPALQSVSFDGEAIERQRYVKVLTQALRWRENPEGPFLRSLVADVILAPNLSADLPAERRQTLSGDKIELFGQLALLEPSLADDLIQRSDDGTRRLLVWARANYATESNPLVAAIRQ